MKRDEITLLTGGFTRRDFLKYSGALGLAMAGGGLSSLAQPAHAQQLVTMSEQLGWFLNSQMAGDVAAIEKGFFREAGIDLKLQPGGPAIDPVQVVAGGGTTFGNAASIGVLLNARAQGLPIKAWGTALQKHPFAFIFYAGSGIRTPKDFEGKTIGIQPTARPLLEAVLKKHNVPKDRVKIVFVGGDTVPLVTRQVDVITGWIINAGQMSAAHQGGVVNYFRLWDLGIRMYAFTYFATEQVLKEKKDLLARFLTASAKGWLYARDHPDEATEMVLKNSRGLDRRLELDTWKNMAPYLTSVSTKQYGWGYMDSKVWADLADIYLSLDQITRPVKPEEVMTLDIWEMAKTPKV
ncbi:MAG: ABC transporter substrate-binding protein [Armatimonadota bacterium]